MPKYTVITEENIKEMVHAFYAKVQQDELIGPIFIHAIGQKWDDHLGRLCDFWSSVLLMSKRYYGDPFRTHMMVQGIEPQHFNRWLELFNETLEELFNEELRGFILLRAERIAERMSIVLFEVQGFGFAKPDFSKAK